MPGFVHRRVVEVGQEGPHRCHALIKRLQYFLASGWLGELEIGSLRRIGLDELNQSARDECEMKRELAGGHGFFVGLPRELVFGQALQESPRDGRLGFEFSKQGLGNGISYDRFCYGHWIDPPRGWV